MPQWQNQQWSGKYWGQKKTKGRGKGQKDDGKEAVKDKGKEKTNIFPSYNSMVVGQASGSSGGSTSSSGQEAFWQQALKSLIVSNPTLTVPKEVSAVLDESMSSDSKKELYSQQRALNVKRKATLRLERLQNALTRQRLQMQAYQEQMRQQLKLEMDKFKAEQKDLEQKVEEAKLILQKIENGEDMTTEEAIADVQEVSLADMLGISSDPEGLVHQANLEKDAAQKETQQAFAMVNQLQQQIHMIMQAGASQSGMGDQMQALLQQTQVAGTTYSPIRSSPQAPVVAPFKRFKTDGTQQAKTTESLDGLG